jgi:hypothetical protein
MLSIIILAASFAVAVLGFVQGSSSDPDKTVILGLTPIGFAMVVIASIGFIFGIVNEIKKNSESKQMAEQATERTKMLKDLKEQIDILAQTAPNKNTANAFKALGDRVEMIATTSRESIFSKSDFQAGMFDLSNFAFSVFDLSNFQSSRFNGANFRDSTFIGAKFQNAIFHDADLRGADLSEAKIDEKTKFPTIE